MKRGREAGATDEGHAIFGIPDDEGNIADVRVFRGWHGTLNFPGFSMEARILQGSADIIQTDKGIFIKVGRL